MHEKIKEAREVPPLREKSWPAVCQVMYEVTIRLPLRLKTDRIIYALI